MSVDGCFKLLQENNSFVETSREKTYRNKICMKSDTQIMNELAINSSLLRVLTEHESKAQKVLLLEMYKDIAALCDAHGLIYMMGGGTCLGAIRHQGYIPWDDDLDIMMPRASYEKLIELLSMGALGEDYAYDAPNAHKDCKNTFLKIYRKGTLDVEITSETAPGPKGMYIDVFPMDYAPNNRLLRRLKGLLSDFLQAVCSCVLYTEYPSEPYKQFMAQSEEGKRRYRQRMILGRLFGVLPHRKWVWWFDRLNACSQETCYMTIPTGRKHYLGECRKTDTYLPVVGAIFEGLKVYVPHRVDMYLTSMYRNYMDIPPVEKRERHFVYQFKLPEK